MAKISDAKEKYLSPDEFESEHATEFVMRKVADVYREYQSRLKPADEIRLRRIINQPKRSIGDKTLAVATEIAQGIGETLFEVISHADEFEALKTHFA